MYVERDLVVGPIIRYHVDGENDDVKNPGDKRRACQKGARRWDCPFVKRRINGIRVEPWQQQVRLGRPGFVRCRQPVETWAPDALRTTEEDLREKKPVGHGPRPSLLVHHIPRQTPGDQSHPDIPCKMWGGAAAEKHKKGERQSSFFFSSLWCSQTFSPPCILFFSPTPLRRARHLSSSTPHHPTHRHLCIATTPFRPPFISTRHTASDFLSHASVKQAEINPHPCPDKSGMFVPQASKSRFLHPFLPKPPPSLSIDSVNH